MHVALLAIYYSVGMIMGILDPRLFATAGKVLFTSGIITLAVFCLSTQFYLEAAEKDR